MKLGQVLWRKVNPDDLHNADRSLHIVTYDLLEREKYDLAIRLLDFACSKPMKHHSDVIRRVHIINRAIAYKWKGREDKCREIINDEDWSACSKDFNLAVAVLLNDFNQAIVIMKEIGKDGTLKEVHYREWPVFKEFRKSREFLKTFKRIYSKDFGGLEMEKEIHI